MFRSAIDIRLWPLRGRSAGWPTAVALLLGLILAFAPLLPAVAVLAPFVAILIFLEPLIGVALMLLAGPWGALENVALGGGLLDSGQMLFFATTAAWLAHGAVKKRITLPWLHIAPLLFLFILMGAVSLLDAPSTREGVIELFKWIEIGAVAMITVDRSRALARRWASGPLRFLTEGGGWRILLLIILLGGLSQALIGIWQFGLRGDGPEHFRILGGAFYRAYGTFEQPNPYGGFMGWMAALALGALLGEAIDGFHKRRVDGPTITWLAFLLVAGVACALALLFSWSRGAWLGFIAGMAAFLLLLPARRAAGALTLCLALLAGLMLWQSGLLPPAVADRLAGFAQDLRFGDVRGADINDANYAVLERLAHWQAALDMAKYNLWSGVGLGNYEAAYPQFALINWPSALGHAHNYYLNILAETGVPGLGIYLGLWLLIVWQTLAVVRRSSWPARGVALGLFAVWTALSAHHLLDKLYVNNLYLALGAMLGMLQLLYERSPEKV